MQQLIRRLLESAIFINIACDSVKNVCNTVKKVRDTMNMVREERDNEKLDITEENE